MAECDADDGAAACSSASSRASCRSTTRWPHVDGATNAVVAEGNFSGRLLFQGAGAGDGPTASAVVADLIDIARGEAAARRSRSRSPSSRRWPPADPGHRAGRAYIRFTVADRPGVLAEITAAMRDAGVSIESLIQQGRARGRRRGAGGDGHPRRAREAASTAALRCSTARPA